MGRIGKSLKAREALQLVPLYFPDHFSVDLMAGLPFQTKADILDDIASVISAGASHVSLYSLILEEGTPLALRAKEGRADLPSEEEADELFLAAHAALEGAGRAQYEVSNFAEPGFECIHNLRYWRMESWLAAGPGSSSTMIDEQSASAERYSIGSDVDAWLLGTAPIVREQIVKIELLQESLLMGFRLRSGIDEEIRRYGASELD
ncbi:hypothetical protein MASR2M78_01380 [Treponema sp.]